ncbi:MAG: DinB family protein [Gracilimonas sp.]
MKNSDYTYDYFLEAFKQAKQTAAELTENVSEDIFLRKPDENKWCMGEILFHLLQTGRTYFSQVRKGLNKPEDKLSRGNGPFTPNFAFRWFIGQVSPENRRKLPTVSAFKPVQSTEIDKQEALKRFIDLQDEFIHTLKKAKLEGLDLDRIKTRNPVIKIVPMSLTACFAVIEAHQRRHFDQMRELQQRFS